MGNAPFDLQPSRIQFIHKVFPEIFPTSPVSTGCVSATHRTSETLRWIHDRLFIDGWQIGAVRSELNQLSREVQTIAITSGKGGVGKTTFAVSLAIAFAQMGRRVLLFDADLGMANAHVFAGINPVATLVDVIDRRKTLAGILEPGPAGIQVLCGASGTSRLANLSAPVLEALGRELLAVAADFDVLIIDTGAGVAPMVTHFLGLAQDTVVVATPNLAATLDAYGMVKVMHESNIKSRMHVLINQADDELQARRVLDRITGCAGRFLSKPLGDLGFLRRDAAIENANQSRRPIGLTDQGSAIAARISAIAAQLDRAPTRSAAQSTHAAA